MNWGDALVVTSPLSVSPSILGIGNDLTFSLFSSVQVNDTSLEDVTHEDAVATLKKTQNKVVIVVARVGMMNAESVTPPPQYQEVVNSSKWFTNVPSNLCDKHL